MVEHLCTVSSAERMGSDLPHIRNVQYCHVTTVQRRTAVIRVRLSTFSTDTTTRSIVLSLIVAGRVARSICRDTG